MNMTFIYYVRLAFCIKAIYSETFKTLPQNLYQKSNVNSKQNYNGSMI